MVVIKRNNKTIKGGNKRLYKGCSKRKKTRKISKRKSQTGSGDPPLTNSWRSGIRRVSEKKIKELQKQIRENILYDKYDWTATFRPKTIDGQEYNHILGLNNPELMTQNYFDLLTFVNQSILDFKSDSNTETVKMYLVEEDKLSQEYKDELREQETEYKAKYELETGEPVDLVEGMVIPRKDETIYFEELDDKFDTMRVFLEERMVNLEKCITKEKNSNGTDGPNTEYFKHEIASCEALLDKYDDIKDKSDKQALTKFVGEISDTLYYNKEFYELNIDYDRLKELIETYLSNANEIDKEVLLSFIPIQFFNDTNDLQILEFIKYLKTNPYQHQQFIYGLSRLLKVDFNKEFFNNNNYIVKSDSTCGDFVYWNYKFNTYYMYLSSFSNNKVFPTKFILPYNYEYPNYDKFTKEIDKLAVKSNIKRLIKEKDTFAFAISSYKSQMFIPSHINELKFIGCLMIKFNKKLKGVSVNVSRIWIIFIFRNSKDYYKSSVKKINFIMCNIQFYITENANITYKQLISYKELKQYYYQSIKADANTNTQISFFKHNLEGIETDFQSKYKPFLFITRRNVNDDEFIELVKRANLRKYNLQIIGEKDKSFVSEKYKYGLTGDIFYLDEDIEYNSSLSTN
jgi:hypothetical protein